MINTTPTMSTDSPTFAVLGVLKNPLSPKQVILDAVAILRSRIDSMDDKMKTKCIHALRGIKDA